MSIVHKIGKRSPSISLAGVAFTLRNIYRDRHRIAPLWFPSPPRSVSSPPLLLVLAALSMFHPDAWLRD